MPCGFHLRKRLGRVKRMAARGPYAKGLAKRAQILDAAVEVIEREGYSGATVRQLSEAVGLSQNGLLHYFGSKDALFTEILRHQDERMAMVIDPDHSDFAADLVERIVLAIEHERKSPGFSRLIQRLGAEATEVGHVANDFFRHRQRALLTIVVEAVQRRQADGRMSSSANALHIAELVHASWDGLRIQASYDETVDVRESMLYLLAALGLERRSEP